MSMVERITDNSNIFRFVGKGSMVKPLNFQVINITDNPGNLSFSYSSVYTYSLLNYLLSTMRFKDRIKFSS